MPEQKQILSKEKTLWAIHGNVSPAEDGDTRSVMYEVDFYKALKEYSQQSAGLRWVKASESGLPTIEVVTLEQLIEHGRNNGANIVNDMPWSFRYKEHSVTHENDDCYLVGWFSVRCTKKNPIVLFNDKVFNYWEKLGRLNIRNNLTPDTLICAEGKWCWFSDNGRGWVRVVPEELKYIEWLDESASPEAVDDKFEFVEWIAKEGYGMSGYDVGKWKKSGEAWGDLITTSELYQLFLKSKQ